MQLSRYRLSFGGTGRRACRLGLAAWLGTAAACGVAEAPAWVADASTVDTPSATSDVPATPDVVVAPQLEPAAPRLHRLTSRQYRNAIADLFGAEIVAPSALEPDPSMEGLIAIGATQASLSPRGVEQYAEGAEKIALQVLANANARKRVVVCEPTGDGRACAETALRATGRRVWRRVLTDAEVGTLLGVYDAARKALDSEFDDVALFDRSLSYPLSMMLQSPFFLYRFEHGEPSNNKPNNNESTNSKHRYTSVEMASRLSFFIWNTTPDEALLDAGVAGELVTDAGIDAQVTRMLADPRARQGVENFFAEWLELYNLDSLSKDPNVFRHYSADLGAAARQETLRLVSHWVFERDGDYRELFTTRETFVNRRLAAIYDIPAPAELLESAETGGTTDLAFAKVTHPASSIRRGLLGQVSFLAQFSHPTSSSATLRGKFVRTKLICGVVPSPPANLNTAIPEPSPTAKTLKERLVVHMQSDECGGCHRTIDPIGFGLENFDGVGRFRTHDNGALIDSSGELDYEPFDDSLALLETIANHPMLAPCFVRTLYGYANGHVPEAGEAPVTSALEDEFASMGYRVKPLVAAIARSAGFRAVSKSTVAEIPTESEGAR